MRETSYSVVIPVYKSQKTLLELYKRVNKVFNDLNKDYELILVEDCGGDGSWEVMKSLRDQDKRVKIIKLMKNFGQHNTLMCGFSFACGEYVIAMDDDLQNPPEEIPKLIDAIEKTDLDVVFGIPEVRKHSLLRNYSSFLFYRLISSSYRHFRDFRISNFLIARKNVVDKILIFRVSYPIVALLLLQVTDKAGNISVQHHERVYDKTTYSGTKLIKLFLNGVLYYSLLPLKGVFILGITGFCLSFILGVLYLVLYIAGLITVSGWTTVVLLLLSLSGIIMVSLGIVGEYLVRLIQESQGIPNYVIREKEV